MLVPVKDFVGVFGKVVSVELEFIFGFGFGLEFCGWG